MASRLRDFRVQLGLVVLGALIVRVVAVVSWSRFFDPQGDQNFYWRQGQDLAQGYGFVYRNNVGERIATAVHPPLYSSYLGVVSALGGTSHAWHRLASTLLGVGAVIVVGLAARRIAGPRAGILAAVLAAIYPNLWINDAMMLSESMYALTIALVLLAAYRFRDRFTRIDAAMLGGAVALAALTRAEAALLAPFLVVPLALAARAQPWRKRYTTCGVALATAALVVAPWVVRNYLTFESHPITLSNGSGFVVEIANCDPTYGIAPPVDSNGVPQAGADADTFLGYWAAECDRTPWPPGDETVVAAAKGKTGTDYMVAHKRQVPVVVAARVGRMWEVWRPGQSYDFNRFFENRKDISIGPSDRAVVFSPVLVAMVMYYPMLVASGAALVVLWRRRVTVIPFVAIFAMTTLTAALSFGITRYRVGADVGLVVLAGVAIDALWRRWRPVVAGDATVKKAAGDPNDGNPNDDDRVVEPVVEPVGDSADVRGQHPVGGTSAPQGRADPVDRASRVPETSAVAP